MSAELRYGDGDEMRNGEYDLVITDPPYGSRDSHVDDADPFVAALHAYGAAITPFNQTPDWDGMIARIVAALGEGVR